jgi:ATP-dependent Clp protease adapter protein ClpS
MSESSADRPEIPRLPNPVPGQTRPPDVTRQLPRCQLVLHYDAAHDLMFVVRSVMELTRFPRAEATYKMWQAHHNGRSILLFTHRERAELYAEQFASKGLTVTVEAAS